MIPLRPALNDYLTMRRALGYKLQRTETLLADFVGFVEVAATDRITIDLALSWATLPAEGDASWWSSRLTVVRAFARYLHTLDPATEVPATGPGIVRPGGTNSNPSRGIRFPSLSSAPVVHSGRGTGVPDNPLRPATKPPPNSSTLVKVCASPPRLCMIKCVPRSTSCLSGLMFQAPTF